MSTPGDDLAGLVVVVIGGTTGMGLSAARRLVAGGAKVVVSSHDAASVDEAAGLLGDEMAVGCVADAMEAGSAERVVVAGVERFGRIDALYHVAGGSGRAQGDGPLHELTDEGWTHTLNLNLTSVMASNRAAVRQLESQGGGGAILNMGSVLGWSPSPEFFASHAYAAAKAAIVGFSKSLAAYYAAANIRVNVIAPGLVESPMSQRALGQQEIMDFVKRKQPLEGGRIGQPQDLDGAVAFLLSRSAAFVTGQVLAVDGGWTVTEGR